MADPMRRYAIFIGVWNTRGEILSADGTDAKLVATDSYRWGPGNKFIVHDVDARMGDAVTRSMEVMGYDARRKRHFARSFDDQGATDTFDIDLTRRAWTIVGATMRFHGAFDRAGDILSGTWERKAKSRWTPWMTIELVRAQ